VLTSSHLAILLNALTAHLKSTSVYQVILNAQEFTTKTAALSTVCFLKYLQN